MTEMVGDEEIYRGFQVEQLSKKEIAVITKVLNLWADVMENLPDEEKSVRIVFGACVNTIGTMGPAYCRVAAATLLSLAEHIDEEDAND